MILNDVMAVILRYFTEFGNFGSQLRKMYPKESDFDKYMIYGGIRRGYREQVH